MEKKWHETVQEITEGVEEAEERSQVCNWKTTGRIMIFTKLRRRARSSLPSPTIFILSWNCKGMGNPTIVFLLRGLVS